MKKLTAEELSLLSKDMPRKQLVFTPTPFHKLENLSKKYDVNIFMKREDLSGPSMFGGNKSRKLEYIIGKALEEKVDYMITYGAYQSNACMQMTSYCNAAGIKPILFLGDTKNEGYPDAPVGNLVLSRILGAEINYVSKPEPVDSVDLNPLWNKVIDECMKKKAELEAQGYKVMWVPVGCTNEYGWIAFTHLYAEVMEQSKEYGDIDYMYHANGSCGSLPALIVSKLLTQTKTEIHSINVRSWKPGNLITHQTCVDRVKYLYDILGLEAPSDEEIMNEIHVDEEYIAPGYGIPNPDAQITIKELAMSEGLFCDPTYSGRGFHGMMDHIRTGKVPKGSNVVFIHTGGAGSFFSSQKLIKELI